MEKFFITTTAVLEGYPVKAYLGTVNTNIVIGTNFFSDFAASFTDIFGGNSGTYQRKMDLMYENAKVELKNKAKKMGANAILGVRIDFDEISGKGKSMFMLSASGTACIIDEPSNPNIHLLKNNLVESYTLKIEMKRRELLSRLQANPIYWGDEEWDFITENPSADILNILLKDYYPGWMDTDKAKFEAILSSMDYMDAVNMVYPLYYTNYDNNTEENSESTIKCDDFTNETISYATLIQRCELLCPQAMERMVSSQPKKTIRLLEFDKHYYSREDLESMKKIISHLENLPNVGEKTIGKSGVFSKEKEIYVCRHGHKNDIENEYCSECGENIKGLTSTEVNRIIKFKIKIETLSDLIDKNI